MFDSPSTVPSTAHGIVSPVSAASYSPRNAPPLFAWESTNVGSVKYMEQVGSIFATSGTMETSLLLK